LSDEDLELVWAATKSGEEIKLEVYKVFYELASKVRWSDGLFIIEKIQNRGASDIISKIILITNRYDHF
jgi:hypothetical protein